MTAIAFGAILPILIIFVLSKVLYLHDRQGETVELVEEDEIEYQHTIAVLLSDKIVSNMTLNNYLVGVVLREMPADFEMDALKAQAVVARTYALNRQQNGGKHSDADICTDSNCCQGYISLEEYLSSGGSQKSIDRVKEAVTETDNIVAIYDGKLIEATYFSCSGGMTEDAVAVWGSDLPYLKATESPGEESATHYTDTYQYSATEFAALLGRSLSGPPGTWIESVSYTGGGGVDEMRICGEVYKGTDLRTKLKLRSTAFVISAVGDTITITTKGFGHRVGMSQYGADAMAVAGYDYREILLHYYQGIELAHYEYG